MARLPIRDRVLPTRLGSEGSQGKQAGGKVGVGSGEGRNTCGIQCPSRDGEIPLPRVAGGLQTGSGLPYVSY